jgi:hypothetical protein
MPLFSRIPPPALPEQDDVMPAPLRKALDAGRFNKRWENRAEFQQWMDKERKKNYAFVCNSKPRAPSTSTGTVYTRYVCHRAAAGGSSERHHAKPKHEPQPGKRGAGTRGAQHIQCPVVLNLREFPGSEIMLGSLEGEHNHKLGGHNVEYERIAPTTLRKMAGMLRQGMTAEAIVRYQHIYTYLFNV